MKKLAFINLSLFVLTMSFALPSCNSSKAKTDKETNERVSENTASGNIAAYYFHATRRCATCEAVESVTKEALLSFYGKNIPFYSINRDEDMENPMLKKYKISGQTLLIIKGDEWVNLTTDAFMNARSNPDKLKAKIKETIDAMQ